MTPVTGLVYYVLDATRSGVRVKVGRTTNLKVRISGLSRKIDWLGSQGCLSGQRPIVIALEAEIPLLESQRHAEFRNEWISHEWFRFEGVLADHVATLEDPVDFLLAREDLWRYASGWGPVPTVKPSFHPTPAPVPVLPAPSPIDPLVPTDFDAEFLDYCLLKAKESQTEELSRFCTEQGITIDQLAARMKAGRHIVVDALRGQKETKAS